MGDLTFDKKEYMREYNQRPEVKEKMRKYYQSDAYKKYQQKRQYLKFNWDDMAEMIRENGQVDITTLSPRRQQTFRSAAEKGIIQINGNIATKTPLTHALDGYVYVDECARRGG